MRRILLNATLLSTLIISTSSFADNNSSLDFHSGEVYRLKKSIISSVNSTKLESGISILTIGKINQANVAPLQYHTTIDSKDKILTRDDDKVNFTHTINCIGKIQNHYMTRTCFNGAIAYYTKISPTQIIEVGLVDRPDKYRRAFIGEGTLISNSPSQKTN